MISLKTNDRGELQFGPDGNLALISDEEAIMQNCRTAMSAQFNEMVFAMQDGMPMQEVIWNKYQPMRFEMAARKTLLKVAGVTGIGRFSQSKNGDTLNYDVEIKTIFGINQLSGFFSK